MAEAEASRAEAEVAKWKQANGADISLIVFA
jgi:hypothetical protein